MRVKISSPQIPNSSPTITNDEHKQMPTSGMIKNEINCLSEINSVPSVYNQIPQHTSYDQLT